MLTDAQIERYSRQIILPEVGGRGQARLLAASVALIGDGHAGAAAALYLVAAGIGRVAMDEAHVGLVADLNPDCWVTPVSDGRWDEAIAGSSFVVCANVEDRQRSRIHSAGGAAARPMLWGYANGALGAMTACASDQRGGLYHACGIDQARALTRAAPDGSHLTAVTAGLIGTLLATSVLKVIIGMEPFPVGQILQYDGRDGTFSESAAASFVSQRTGAGGGAAGGPVPHQKKEP